MPRMTGYRHGVPNWVDLAVDDISAAGDFYGSLFGWTLSEDLGPDAGGYRMFRKNGLDVAGVGPRMDPAAPAAWTTYVNVDDVDAAAERVAKAGGTVVVPPMDLPNGSGRIAFAVDPTGGFVGLFQAGAHIGSVLVNELGTLAWNELVVRDAPTAAAFYEQVFGWTTEPMEGDVDYHLFKVQGRVVAGCLPMGESFPEGVPTHWMPYFVVEDVDASAARAQELGGAVVVPAQDMAVGRFSAISDNGGAALAIMRFNEGMLDDPNAWPS